MAKMGEAVVREVFRAFNEKDREAMQRLVGDANMTVVPFGTTVSGMEDFEFWVRAFPDGKLEARNIVSTGDKVFVEAVGRGTHKGALEGPFGRVEPTGRRTEVPFVQYFELTAQGKIKKMRLYLDALGMLRQLGIGERRPMAEEAEASASM